MSTMPGSRPILDLKDNVGMSTSKDMSGHKMCPLDVKLISSIRKFHFSSSESFLKISVHHYYRGW